MKKILALILMLALLCPAALAAEGLYGEVSLGNVMLYAGDQQAMDLSKIALSAKGAAKGNDAGFGLALIVDGVPYDLTAVAEGGALTVASSLLSSAYQIKAPVEQIGDAELPSDVDAETPFALVKQALDSLDETLASVAYTAEEPGETYTIYTGAEYTAAQVDTFEPVELDVSEMLSGYKNTNSFGMSGKRMVTPASDETGGTALTMYKLTVERRDKAGKVTGSWPVCYLVQDVGGSIVRDIDVHREKKNQLFAISERVLDGNTRSIEASVSSLKTDVPIAYAIYTLMQDETGDHVALSAALDAKNYPSVAINAFGSSLTADKALTGQMTYYLPSGSAFEQLMNPDELKKGTVAGVVNFDGAMGADDQSASGQVTLMQGKYALVADVALNWAESIAIAIGDKPVIDASSMTAEQSEALSSEALGGLMRLVGAVIGAAPELSGIVSSAMEKVA